MIDGPEADERFSLVEHPMSPRALAAPLHRHNREDEYSYVVSGRMGALLGDDVVEAGPGDLVFKPRGQWHTFWNAGDEPCHILEIISPAGFERFFAELVDTRRRRRTPSPSRSASCAARYALEMQPDSVPELTRALRPRVPRRAGSSAGDGAPKIAAIPPPTTKPATTAPAITWGRWRLICARQSAIETTSPRSDTSDRASSPRLASIEARTCSGVRWVAHASLVLRLRHDLTDLVLHQRRLARDRLLRGTQLGDRDVGRRRLRLLERARRQQTGDHRHHDQQERPPGRSPRRTASSGKNRYQASQAKPCSDQQSGSREEHARGDADGRAAPERLDLLLDLELGELDLVADERLACWR